MVKPYESDEFDRRLSFPDLISRSRPRSHPRQRSRGRPAAWFRRKTSLEKPAFARSAANLLQIGWIERRSTDGVKGLVQRGTVA
jgi:hypothetical protein